MNMQLYINIVIVIYYCNNCALNKKLVINNWAELSIKANKFDKSQHFAINEFNNCFIYNSIYFQNIMLPVIPFLYYFTI